MNIEQLLLIYASLFLAYAFFWHIGPAIVSYLSEIIGRVYTYLVEETARLEIAKRKVGL